MASSDTPSGRPQIVQISDSSGGVPKHGVPSAWVSSPRLLRDYSRVSLRLLAERVTIIDGLVKRGAFSEVWVPAFQAKDLALALDVRSSMLAAARRLAARGAVDRLVRAAWALDAAGDIGNRSDVESAATALTGAAHDLEQVFAR